VGNNRDAAKWCESSNGTLDAQKDVCAAESRVSAGDFITRN
jgi:hypothetical protein